MRRKSMPKYVGDKPKIVIFANGANRFGFRSNICRSSNEFRVGITHLITTQSPYAYLVDEHPTSKAMVNNSPTVG
jgi:hypothetical protein